MHLNLFSYKSFFLLTPLNYIMFNFAVFTELFELYTENLNKFSGRQFLIWNAISSLVDPVYDKLKQDAEKFIRDREPNKTPKEIEQVLNHFRGHNQLSKYVSSLEKTKEHSKVIKVCMYIYIYMIYKV